MFSFSDFPEKFSKVVTVVFQANYKCFVQCLIHNMYVIT